MLARGEVPIGGRTKSPVWFRHDDQAVRELTVSRRPLPGLEVDARDHVIGAVLLSQELRHGFSTSVRARPRLSIAA